MTRDDWPSGADWQQAYMAWNLPKDENEAAAEFERAHGKPPEFVFATKHGGGVLRAGPVEAQQ